MIYFMQEEKFHRKFKFKFKFDLTDSCWNEIKYEMNIRAIAHVMDST